MNLRFGVPVAILAAVIKGNFALPRTGVKFTGRLRSRVGDRE